ELSQDLASEVALRTREMEAQRSFAAQIIASLPVGLYVIDRGYRIRAWNRKRETGTQGVSREDAVGREIFDVLDRQPRDLLKREFDRVFDTGELQQVEMESQASGEVRHYRITKIPMHQDGGDISHVITIGEDITEWRQAQQRLTETEKLAAVVGRAVGGLSAAAAPPIGPMRSCSSSSTRAPGSSARTCRRSSSRSSRPSRRGAAPASVSPSATASSPSTGGGSRSSRRSAWDRTSGCISPRDENPRRRRRQDGRTVCEARPDRGRLPRGPGRGRRRGAAPLDRRPLRHARARPPPARVVGSRGAADAA